MSGIKAFLLLITHSFVIEAQDNNIFTNLFSSLLPFNTICVAGAQRGICENFATCGVSGGVSIGTGTCTLGKICCQRRVTCGGVMSSVHGVYHNPAYPSADTKKSLCNLKIAILPTTCAVSVYFPEFQVGTREDGLCYHDYFTILNIPGSNMVNLCGNMKGHWQTFYISSVSTPVLDVYNVLQTSNKWFINVIQHDNCTIPSLESPDCGQENVQPQNPTATDPMIYPWAASLMNKDKSLYCGATLLTNSYVITSAQCVSSSTVDDVWVVVGHSETGTIDTYVQSRKASRIVFPWTFKSTKSQMIDDFALVKMDPPVSLTNHHSPICFPTLGELPLETKTISAGRIYPSTKPTRVLEVSGGTVISSTDCANRVTSLGWTLNTDTLCVQESGQCIKQTGHSVSATRATGRHELAGVLKLKVCDNNKPVSSVFNSLNGKKHWMLLNLR